MDLHYDHPILFLQHMLCHEGYHHGQIKRALKLAGRDEGALFVGQWAAPFLLMGVYNKLVKQMGSHGERASQAA